MGRIHFIKIPPTAPIKAAVPTNNNPIDTVKFVGSKAINMTPAKASIIPKPRRQPIVSPRKAMLIKVANGTPN